ncbi:MAG: Cobalt-zinc-cadmium resistance protein CzcA, partial [Bacteroidota bacterium]
GGDFENLQSASLRLMLITPVVLLLIFLLLYTSFKSTRLAMLIFLAVPMAASGGIYALKLRAMPFSISAGVGFIALFGVAVLNGLVWVSAAEHLRRRKIPLHEATRETALSRLRPVLMTAFVASLGFLPMALSTSDGAEMQRPLATVVIGGLVTSTLLTLYVIPTVFRVIYSASRKF